MAKSKHQSNSLDAASEIPEERSIDAMPTKELFIDMLTRDIALMPAIIDLVDNCGDGARRLRGNGSLEGLWARLEIGGAEFRISDNCGGIDVETARKYAFRFGRPPGAPSVKHSVGQFGVGMKRAIFKLGTKFTVESSTASSRFVVDVDVLEWATKPKWEFEFKELEESITVKPEDQGTTITVSVLHADVAEKFSNASFVNEFTLELQQRLQEPISRAFAVTIGGVPINNQPFLLLESRQLAPASQELKFEKKGEKTVRVKLYCGIGRSQEREAAGWHVFCNGRLVLQGDKSATTGWGEEIDGLSIPGFHGQYNHFRGLAYFDCDDAGRLPWNTTKTGLNTDSAVYRGTRLEMMKLMRPVVDFLNNLKDEKQNADDGAVGPLEKLVEVAKPVEVKDIATRDVFVVPKKAHKQTGPKMQKIQYEKPFDLVLKVMSTLGATSYKDVGERTFDYFYNNEVD